jgi:aminopeptidase
MVDPRVERMAEILVDHCMEVKEGEVVQIKAYSDLAKPLVSEVYSRALQKGAKDIITHIELEELRETFVREASEDQLAQVSPLRMHEAEYTDVFVEILAPVNTKLLSDIGAGRVAKWERAQGQLWSYLVEHTRWAYTLYPTSGAAQDAGMSLTDFEDFVFGAVDIDWQQFSRDQQPLLKLFQGASEVAIKGHDTDLTMSVKGRTFVSADGKENMPDGEIFTGPVEDSVEGHILFSYPAIFPSYGGQEVEGVRLWFQQGKVVRATASKGEDYLLAMLDMDEGARYVGELGIGTNYNIDRFVKNILFDEKIGGTIHLALGKAYWETGGKNESGLHWDMIKDLRDGGEIYLDGTLVQKDGVWVR